MKQLLFLLLFPCLAVAQYTGNAGQKITLGEQTTADGLVYRGLAADTTRKPIVDTMAYILLDTNTNIIWQYKKAVNNAWTRLNLLPSDTTSFNYVNTYGTQTVNGAKTFISTVTGARFDPTSSSATGTGMYLPANNILGLSTAGVARMFISSAGSFGIGVFPDVGHDFQMSNNGTDEILLFAINNSMNNPTTNSTARLDFGVYGGTGNYIPSNTVIGQSNYIGQANDASYVAGKIDVIVTNAGNVGRAAGHSGIMRFYTKPTNANGVSERMRINEVGEVGIGYDATDNGAYRLQVKDSVYVGGNVSASAYTTRSDYDLKDEIQNISYGINEVMQMQPVKYTYKSNGSTQLGFIAQDLGVITPEVVSFEDKMSVYYNALIPILTKAIQEQQALIKALEQRILILENK